MKVALALLRWEVSMEEVRREEEVKMTKQASRQGEVCVAEEGNKAGGHPSRVSGTPTPLSE